MATPDTEESRATHASSDQGDNFSGICPRVSTMKIAAMMPVNAKIEKMRSTPLIAFELIPRAGQLPEFGTRPLIRHVRFQQRVLSVSEPRSSLAAPKTA
jgi:hypothetical protein